MSRKNRVTIPDGIYHITSRVCNKALLFKQDEIKEKIAKWMYDIADFSGIEIYSWCIMDNHMHLLVHVPRVPERLWTDPSREPDAWAFGMRPAECQPPLWAEGDCPRSTAGAVYVLPRPDVGFTMSDEEMLRRLARLYSRKVAEEFSARWERLRQNGRGEEVEVEKSRYCRRMYNISQFVKTLKERIAMRYNEEFEHEGCLWQGRFYSGVVENAREVLAVVAGYIEYNPVKARLVASPETWHYSSWSAAMNNGPWTDRCRRMYCEMLGCDWDVAKRIIGSVLDDRLPNDVDPETIRRQYDKYNEEEISEEKIAGRKLCSAARVYRASQIICCGMWFFKKGGYIGRTMSFARAAVSHLNVGFPRVGFRSINRCRAFVWKLPHLRSAA